MSVDANILEKIKKLFALGTSNNVHESALALEMAQKLMAKHNVTTEQVEVGAITEEDLRSVATATKVKSWELRLCRGVSQAFGCELLFKRGYPYGFYTFIGPATEVALGVYAAVYLQRQLVKARAAFTKTLPEWLERSEKTSEIDSYCQGWVESALKKVEVLVPHPAKAKAIELHMKALSTVPVKANIRGGGSLASLSAGITDGNGISLNRPMDGEEDRTKKLGSGQ